MYICIKDAGGTLHDVAKNLVGAKVAHWIGGLIAARISRKDRPMETISLGEHKI